MKKIKPIKKKKPHQIINLRMSPTLGVFTSTTVQARVKVTRPRLLDVRPTHALGHSARGDGREGG